MKDLAPLEQTIQVKSVLSILGIKQSVEGECDRNFREKFLDLEAK